MFLCVLGLYNNLYVDDFCVNHQNPHSHNCSFNNKKICQEAIKLNNPQTIHQKVIKI